jgi:hypothetical protein
MKPTDPLTPAEIAVFGSSATRNPVTGEICEQGFGSKAHEERIAAGLRREALCRGESPAVPPQPAPEPPPSAATPPAERFIDRRLVHDFPLLTQ